jgi:hypothetical protein
MVKMIKTKKGVSGHIELIISFLIFITFVAFLLIFVNPIKKTNTNTHYIDMTESAIMENITTNLTTFSVVLPSSASQCFCIPYNLPRPDAKLIVKDEEGNFISATSALANICIGAGNRFHKVYFSEEFAESGVACDPLTNTLAAGTYNLGVLNDYKKVSNKSLYSLNNSYNEDYGKLKTELAITWDFNIIVNSTLNGEYLVYGKTQEPKNSEVMAREIPIEVINESGGFIPAIMSLQVW